MPVFITPCILHGKNNVKNLGCCTNQLTSETTKYLHETKYYDEALLVIMRTHYAQKIHVALELSSFNIPHPSRSNYTHKKSKCLF